ncbi:MAG: signal peptidase II, partial [Clostridia bacterium]
METANDNIQVKDFKKLKFWLIMAGIVVVGIATDQITKAVVAANIYEGEQIKLIGDWLYFTYVKNPGASFGLLGKWEYANILFFCTSIIGIPLFVYLLYIRRKDNIVGSVGFAMMISGSIGNAIDRIIFARTFFDGYVRDFIGVEFFAVFNIADSCMCIGVALLVISMLFLDKEHFFNKNKTININENTTSKNNNENSGVNKSVINWYPGHMAKAKREILDKIRDVDCIIEVIDARIPISSHIKEIDDFLGKKNIIIVLNKYDLCDKEISNKFIDYYIKKGYIVITSDSKN